MFFLTSIIWNRHLIWYSTNECITSNANYHLNACWTAESSNLLAEQCGAFCTPLHSGDAAGSFHYALQYKSPVETQDDVYKMWISNISVQFIL